MTEAEAQALINEGAGIDAQAAAYSEAAISGNLDANGGIVAPDPDQRAMGWFIVPKTLAWAITTVFPETRKHYTDEACMQLARDIVPVAEIYGLEDIGDSPQLTLLMSFGMFCAPAYLAHKSRKAAALELAQQEAEANGSRE